MTSSFGRKASAIFLISQLTLPGCGSISGERTENRNLEGEIESGSLNVSAEIPLNPRRNAAREPDTSNINPDVYPPPRNP